jgi:pimeloyl-ACP methyl ester carboxylesterase
VDDPHPQSLAGLRHQIEAVNGHDTRERLRNITAKTLVLVGEKDILARPGDVEMLCREIPRALPLVSLSGSAHAVHMENPGTFAATVMEFLSKA